MPFAHDLVAALRPSCLVELGTHFGESYFGFCQAVAENQIPCVAYAVDTWLGEPHAGLYDESVYQEVQAYNQANYASFSYLLRKLFDDALEQFTDNSIDLLHIDGMHTLEAVSHDFYSWLPKVRPGGVILLHDVCVRDRDFGVWKLWDDLKAPSRTFEFHHAWGLGVFQKPGPDALYSVLLEALFEGSSEVQNQIRRYYVLAANELDVKHRREILPAKDTALLLQVYPSSKDGYQEAHSTTVTVEPDEWQHIKVDVAKGSSTGVLRLDPVSGPAVIELRGMSLTSPVDQSTVWSGAGPELAGLEVGGTLIPLGLPDTNGAVRLFSYGKDPQIYLPSLPAGQFDQPLTFHVWLRVHLDFDSLLPIIQKALQPPEIIIPEPEPEIEPEPSTAQQSDEQVPEIPEVEEDNRKAEADARDALIADLNRTQTKLVDDLNRKQTKLYLLEDAWQELQQEHGELQQKFVALEKSYSELRETYSVLEAAHSEIQAAHQALRQAYENILRSRSWRLTAPLRSVTEAIK